MTVLSPGGVNYFYDKNGNLIKKVTQDKTVTYSYDYENRLTAVKGLSPGGTVPEVIAEYIYDGEGKRITATENGTTTHYLYDGLNVIIERNPQGETIATYTRGLSLGGGIGGIISSLRGSGATEATSYYHYDALGNVINLTDSTGLATDSYTYTAFGDLIAQAGTTPNPYQFSTKPYNPTTGLVHFGFRYYNPSVGRFITMDPLGMVNGPNLYAYVTNDPINWFDPWGLCEDKEAPTFPPDWSPRGNRGYLPGGHMNPPKRIISPDPKPKAPVPKPEPEERVIYLEVRGYRKLRDFSIAFPGAFMLNEWELYVVKAYYKNVPESYKRIKTETKTFYEYPVGFYDYKYENIWYDYGPP